MAEEKLIKQKAAVKKPAQRRNYRTLAENRVDLKKNYVEARRNDDEDAISDFLASMGHNVASSMMQGRIDDYEETRRDSFVRESDDLDISNWMASRGDDSTLEELENPDFYENRRVGVKVPKPWIKKRCPSCRIGFNSRSSPIKCDGCDSYTHRKQTCIKEASQKSQFYCKICVPTTAEEVAPQETSEINAYAFKVDNGFR